MWLAAEGKGKIVTDFFLFPLGTYLSYCLFVLLSFGGFVWLFPPKRRHEYTPWSTQCFMTLNMPLSLCVQKTGPTGCRMELKKDQTQNYVYSDITLVWVLYNSGTGNAEM